MATQISEKDKSAIMDAAMKLYSVSHDENGSYIELTADYYSFNDFLRPVAYDHRDDEKYQFSVSVPENNLLHSLKTTIDESWSEAIWLAEDEILRTAGFNPDDDRCMPQKEWLRDNIPVYPPYNHYLDQSINVNFLLFTQTEANHHFSDIPAQFMALSHPDVLTDTSPEVIKTMLNMDTSLKSLVEQQGYTMTQLASTMKDYTSTFSATDKNAFNKTQSPFLTSVCAELQNFKCKDGFITVLASVSLNEFVDMMKHDSEFVMPANSVCGMFSPSRGVSSELGIQPEHPLHFSRNDIYDIQIEGVEPDFGVLLSRVHTLSDDSWKSPDSIHISPENKKQETLEETINSTLDSMLESAAARAGVQANRQSQPALEMSR